MPNHTRVAVHVIATTLFGFFLCFSVALAYYTWVAMPGDYTWVAMSGEGGVLTDSIGSSLQLQQTAIAATGGIFTALPALSLGLANDDKGEVTKEGRLYLLMLVPTFLIATAVNVIMDPVAARLFSADIPALVDTAALRISGFSLTFVTAILGLSKLLGKPDPKKKGAI